VDRLCSWSFFGAQSVRLRGVKYMKRRFKNLFERTTFLGTLARRRRDRRMELQYADWVNKGSVLPMPHLGKRNVLLEYITRFEPRVFIETGTYTGHMVYAMLNKFKEIYSIELDYTLAEKAKMKFMGYRNVHIIQGDSAQVLPVILEKVSQPCLFWLDARYSGGKTAKGELETPIMRELSFILNHPVAGKHILLIDDARCFTGQNDYPALGSLETLIKENHPDWIFEVKDDIIRAHAGKS